MAESPPVATAAKASSSDGLEEASLESLSGAVTPVDAAASAPVATPAAADRLRGTDKPTVWSEFGEIAAETGATNLGQGFPDWDPPQFVVDEAHAALDEGVHQYTRPAGHPPLVEVLARRYSAHLGQEIDPMAEVAVTVGASQALYLTLQALINPGDEVLLPEPAFDLYYGQVRLAGGSVKPVPLAIDPLTDGWRIDLEALETAASSGTAKVLILNSPHNPTGTAFTVEEMTAVAAIVRRNPQLRVISDEVYKYTVFDQDARHFHFASLPGMFERTVTLSSAGKTFSITGWQAGWCVGPPSLIKPIQLLLPFVQFCVSAPIQHALARVLDKADEPYEGHPTYYDWLRAMLRRKRETLDAAVRRVGMVPMPGQGGITLLADVSSVHVPAKYLGEPTPACPGGVPKDWALCRYLAYEGGVIAIPASPFFSPGNRALGERCYVRFAFCKSDETLEAAAEKMAALLLPEAARD